jgi:DUF1707 SHOCT-like domain/Cell wall-active antibiotics response LiaF, C-terminal
MENEAPVTPARRELVIQALCEAYAQDQLATEELERRLDDANRVRTESELKALLADLDIAKLTAPGTAVAPSRSGAPSTGVAAPLGPPLPGRADGSRVPERQVSIGIWSGRVKRGSWIPAKHITAAAVMGGVELDFREAVFGPDPVQITAAAVMGGVQIIVPPNVTVETSGFALMGGLNDRSETHGPPRPGDPVLRINGFAVMGGIDIDVRLPGESVWQARRRRKRRRRERRAED